MRASLVVNCQSALVGIALSLPCDDLVDEDLLVGYTLRSASFCARAAHALTNANPLAHLQEQRDQFALAMRVRLGKD